MSFGLNGSKNMAVTLKKCSVWSFVHSVCGKSIRIMKHCTLNNIVYATLWFAFKVSVMS